MKQPLIVIYLFGLNAAPEMKNEHLICTNCAAAIEVPSAHVWRSLELSVLNLRLWNKLICICNHCFFFLEFAVENVGHEVSSKV